MNPLGFRHGFLKHGEGKGRNYSFLVDSTYSRIRSYHSKQFEHSVTECTTDVCVDICPAVVVVIAVVGIVARIVHEVCCGHIDGVIAELIVQCDCLLSSLHGVITVGTPKARSSDGGGQMTRLKSTEAALTMTNKPKV